MFLIQNIKKAFEKIGSPLRMIARKKIFKCCDFFLNNIADKVTAWRCHVITQSIQDVPLTEMNDIAEPGIKLKGTQA
jgi:hypothetical protein